MGFSVTDEALEALDKSDEQTRTKFFEGLNDQERQSIADAVPGWKAKRSQADSFVSFAGQGAQGRTPTSPGMDLGSGDSLATLTPEQKVIAQGVDIPHPPLAGAISWLGDKARGAANSLYDLNNKVMGEKPVVEMLHRSVLSSALGPKILEDQPEEKRLQAINTMEASPLGQNGTTAALVASQAVGNAMQMALPAGKASQLAEGAPLVARMMIHGGAGGIMGGAQAAFQGEDPIAGGMAGMALGAGGQLVGAAASKAAPVLKKGYQKVATYTGAKAQGFWRALETMHTPQVVGETAPILGAEVAGKAPEMYPVGQVKPSYFKVTKDEEGLKALVADYSLGRPRKEAELRLEEPGAIDKFVSYLKKHEINGMIDDSALNELSHYDATKIMNPHSTIHSKVTGEEDVWGMGWDEYKKYQSGLDTLDRRTISLKSPVGPKPPDIDAPVVASPMPDFELHADATGHVKLVPPEPPGPRGKSLKSERGFIKQIGPDGAPMSMTVDRLANDPDVPGNVLVSGKNDELISVPAGEFHPQHSVEESMAVIKAMGAQPVRRPAEPIKPGDISPQTMAHGQILNEEVKTLVRRNPTWGQAIFGKTGLVSKHHMGDLDMAALLLESNAAKDHAAMRGEALHALTKAAGGTKQLNTLMDYEMRDVMTGKMSMHDFAHKYPEMTKRVKPLVENMMARRNELHAELVNLGAVNGDINQADMEAYLTQNYYRYLFPKKWAKLAGANTVEHAAQNIVKQMEGRGEKWTGQQVYSELTSILGSENPAQAFYASEMGKSKAFDSLRAKQVLPDFMKGLLGEVKSGMYSMAETLARQEQLVARFRLYHEVAANPAYYSHGPQPHLDQRMVPANAREFGPLAGGYVAPEIYESIIEMPKTAAHAANFMNKLTSFRKGNQMASVRAHIRNNLGSWQSSVLAGGLEPWRPIQSAKDMRSAAKALSDYMADPTGQAGLGSIVKEMRFAGADWAGHAETEVGKDSPYIREMLKKIAKENGKDAFDITEKLMHGTWGKYKNAIAKNGGMLDLQDRFYRVANYIGLKRKFMGNPERYLKGVPPADVEKEAIKLAARRINDSFMNASHVGKTVDALRKSNVGMLAPYGTAMAEEARMMGMIPSRMAEDPDLKWRLAAWGIFGAAGVGALTHGLGGTPPEAFESAKGNMTDMSRSRRVGLLPIPLTGMGEDNPVRLFDASQYFLPGQLMMGDPNDSMMSRVFANALTYPASGGTAEGPERGLLEALGVVKPINYTPKQMESDLGITKFADQLMRGGGVPAQVAQVKDAVDKQSYNGRWGVKWNPADAAGKLAFTGYVGPTSPTSPAGIKEDKGERRDLHGELKVISRLFAAGKITQQEAERRMKIVVGAIQASGQKTEERGNLMGKYMNSYQAGKK